MLGSRKLLIVLCIVPCVFSLCFIGALAAPAEDVSSSVEFSLETEVVEDIVRSSPALAEETFPALSLLESSYYSYSGYYLYLPASSASALDGIYSIVVTSALGTYVWGIDFSNLPNNSASVYRTTSGGVNYIVWGSSDSERFALPDSNPYKIYLKSSSSSLVLNGSSVSGTLVEESLVPDIADSIFDLGDAFVSFVVSSWIVMIPLAAWLVILCIGAIRKLVKGV